MGSLTPQTEVTAIFAAVCVIAMPVTPIEIMLTKIGSMGLVVLMAAAFALIVVVQGVLRVPVLLFLAGTVLHLFATTLLAVFMAILTNSMPQFGLLTVLILLPLQMLSGGATPRENIPVVVQYPMLIAPTTHFVSFSQSILFRGARIDVVWPQFLTLAAIGSSCFGSP